MWGATQGSIRDPPCTLSPSLASSGGPEWSIFRLRSEEISVGGLRAWVRPKDAEVFANLTSVGAEPVGEGVATSTQIYRLRLGYGPGARAGPATMIAKMPSFSPEVREVARGWSTYQREVLFYREVAATIALRIPKPYVAEFDPRTHGFVVVMEDLPPPWTATR